MKKALKITVDVLMYVLFVLLMEEHLIFDEYHEILGVGVFVLFLAHTILNYKWYANMFRGRYNALRILRTVVNLLLLIMFVICFVSALMISGTVFAWLRIGDAQTGRQLHLLSTAWVFVLMSLHLGLHWGSMVGFVTRKTNSAPDTAKIAITWIMRAAAAAAAVFGIVIFVQRAFYEEMLLTVMYKQYDYSASAVLYALETACISVLFAAVAYYVNKLILFLRLRKKENKNNENEQNA